MTGKTFEELLVWTKAKDSRTLDISVGRHAASQEVTAFVYDYLLETGQRVNNVQEINLEQATKARLQATIARLQNAIGSG